MRGSTCSQNLQDSKQNTQTRRYPVSARAYKKKDYDYLSTFPRRAKPVALRASNQHEDIELSHEQSDVESDLFTTASYINESTSVSSASSTSSSNKSFTKNGSPLTYMESNPQHQSDAHHGPPRRHHHHHHHRQHHEGHHLQIKETNTLSAAKTMENTDLQEVDDENSGSGSSLRSSKAESKDSKSDLSSSAGENDSVDVKEGPVKLRAKVGSRHVDKPAVLPKFGSWDTKNPSSGEAYTLIFRRLRDEKKSGAGVPVCGSPTHPKAEEPDESPIPESKAKEPLCPKPRTGKDPSRRKEKPTSHHDAAHSRTVIDGFYVVRPQF